MSVSMATSASRVRLIVKLLGERVGEWIPAHELATAAGGPEYSQAIVEMKMQGYDVSERREYHRGQSLVWFRLNRKGDW